MIKQTPKKSIRMKKHWRSRNKIKGTPERPRLAVFRSTQHIYAQIIDDTVGKTLVAASTLEVKVDGTKAVGAAVAKKALENGIEKVVFDRGGNLYHGRIQALAEGAREAGLDF